MNQPAPQNRVAGRATPNVALWLLGVMMAGQVAAIVWALCRKPAPVSAASAPAPDIPADSREREVAAARQAPPADPTAQAPGPGPASFRAGTGDGQAILDTPLPGNVLYFLESALDSRERGDMKAALTKLRAANDLLPDHPRLLYELATAYEKMALREKAAEVWDRILKLGPGAGPFFKMAEMKFEDGVARESREIQTALRLGKILVRRDSNPAVEEQWTVRIPVQASDGAAIDPSKVHVDVLFFDQLPGQQVEPTRGDISPGRWMTGVPQWLASPVEFLELTCRQPKMPAVGLDPPPGRRFHGYVIKLYYNDQLQDVAAEPKQLANRAHEPGERPLENAVDRPVVDDSLFPLPVK